MEPRSFKEQLPFFGFIFLFSIFFFHWTAVPVLQDPDGYWHLEAGRLLLETDAIPTSDPWSFTAGEYPWYNLSWGFDAASAWIYEIGGITWLQSMMVTLYALLLTFLCWVLTRHQNVKIAAACLTVMLVALSMWELFSLRPHVITYFFTLLFYYLLRSAYEGKERRLYLLPPLMLLWGNLHGGFLAGFVVVGVFAVSALFAKNFAIFFKLLVVVAISLPLLLINPYGVHILDAVLRSLDSVITPYIDEWAAFVPGKFVGITSYFILFIVLSYVLQRKNQKIALYDKLLVLVWAVLAITSIRHFPIFAMLSAPYLALILSESGYMREYKQKLSVVIGRVVVLLAVLVPLAIGFSWLPSGLFYEPSKESRTNIEPEVMQVLKQFPERRFLNHYAMGGWLIYHSHGAHRVFIDSRAGTAYPESLLNDYLQLMTTDDNWIRQRILEHYGIDGVVTSKNHPFARIFRKGEFAPYWQIVFEGERSIVFIKKTLFANVLLKKEELSLWSH